MAPAETEQRRGVQVVELHGPIQYRDPGTKRWLPFAGSAHDPWREAPERPFDPEVLAAAVAIEGIEVGEGTPEAAIQRAGESQWRPARPGDFLAEGDYLRAEDQSWAVLEPVGPRNMSGQPVVPGPIPWRALATAVVDYLKRDVPRALLFAAIAGVVSFLLHLYVMAAIYDGWTKVPFLGPAIGEGNEIPGSVFWAIFSFVAFAILGYWLAVGNERFWREVRSLPQQIRQVISAGGERTGLIVLWAFAGTTVVLLVVSPALSAVLGFGLLVAFPTVLGALVAAALFRAWNAAVRKLSPGKGLELGGLAEAGIALLGGISALGLGILVEPNGLRLVFGVGAAIAAIAIRQRSKPAAAPTILMIGVGLAALAALLHVTGVMAHDGGIKECGGTWPACPGSDQVWWRSIFGGLIGAGGGAAGGGFGSTMGDGKTPGPFHRGPPDTPPVGQLTQMLTKDPKSPAQAQVKHPGDPNWYTAYPGMDLRAGDQIRTDGNTIVGGDFVTGGRFAARGDVAVTSQSTITDPLGDPLGGGRSPVTRIAVVGGVVIGGIAIASGGAGLIAGGDALLNFEALVMGGGGAGSASATAFAYGSDAAAATAYAGGAGVLVTGTAAVMSPPPAHPTDPIGGTFHEPHG